MKPIKTYGLHERTRYDFDAMTTLKEVVKVPWSSGEWDNEPDRIEWRHGEYPCLMVRNRMGAWCGYVGVPVEHPWYGKNVSDDDIDCDVHGGVTWTNDNSEREHLPAAIAYEPRDGEPELMWWVGFDCLHFMDHAPGMPDYGDGTYYPQRFMTYKHEAWVTEEVEHLAAQAQARMEMANLALDDLLRIRRPTKGDTQ